MVARIGSELVPDSGPGVIVDQRRMLPGVELTLVRNLTGVDRVRQQPINMAAREGFAASLGAIRCRAVFCPQPEAVGLGRSPLRPGHAGARLLHDFEDSAAQTPR